MGKIAVLGGNLRGTGNDDEERMLGCYGILVILLV